VYREVALFYMFFERLGKGRHLGLETELRGILKEKGLRDHDPFDDIIAQSQVIDLNKKLRFDEVISIASKMLSEKISYPAKTIEENFMEGTKVGATPVSSGVALPHMRMHHLVEPILLLVRSKEGIDIHISEDFWGGHEPTGPIYAIFFLISAEENPRQHLRILAKLAGRVDDEFFMKEWQGAENEQELKEILLRDERFLSIELKSGTKAAKLIGQKISELEMPEQSLIAIIHRDGKTIVPRGNHVLREKDSLTVIGDKKGIQAFRDLYGYHGHLD